jgi:hypothetical protein
MEHYTPHGFASPVLNHFSIDPLSHASDREECEWWTEPIQTPNTTTSNSYANASTPVRTNLNPISPLPKPIWLHNVNVSSPMRGCCMSSNKADPQQESPTHNVSLQWLVGFGEYFYHDNLAWCKRSNLVFGTCTLGQISRLILEHLFVMEQ